MYCRVLACDYDGTGAFNNQLAPEVACALARAREMGFVTLLVTGRILEDLKAACPDTSLFDAVVAENGAVIWFAGRGSTSDRTIAIGAPPSESFLAELRRRAVPIQSGEVIVATWDSHTADVLELLRASAMDGQLVFNRSALMVLPSGVNKATGVRRALELLGRSHHNLIAFGDAENDVPLLAMAEMSVAARGAVRGVEAMADERLAQPGGAGVARFIHRVLDDGGIVPTPSRQRLVLGHASNGEPVAIPAAGMNVLISGDPRSGKSWMAGWIAELLLERDYRVCIFDREGDYLSLATLPNVLAFGADLPLPSPAAAAHLSSRTFSLVLSLANLSLKEQEAYTCATLREMEESRAASGLPHWILLDEAHYFFHETSPACSHLSSPTGNFLLVTYRPSRMASAVFDAVRAHVVMHIVAEEERYALTGVLQTRGPRDLDVAAALAALEMPSAGLLIESTDAPLWQVFTPGRRRTEHAHHARKYSDVCLPEERAFRFLETGESTPPVAHNMREFHAALLTLPASSLRHHLTAGDFSRWVGEVLGHRGLAASLREIERLAASGGALPRRKLLEQIEAQYAIPR